MTKKKQPFILLILDGFGYSKEQEYNAIALANTPNWDNIWQNNPHTLLNCSGSRVGLPEGQIGNSEVGHMNIGAGRVIYQDLSRIDNEINNGEFYNNQVLTHVLDESKNSKALHVIGLVSKGGVHSHLRHYLALAKMASEHNITNLYIHAFLDGRDTAPKSAYESLEELDSYLKTNNIGKIVSIVGRYYAMDRDNRLERTELAFDLLTNNIDNTDLNKNYFISNNIKNAIDSAYARGETDEFVKPTIIAETLDEYDNYKITDNNNVIFMNFRADRARQISHMLLNNNKFTLNKFVTLTEYKKNLTEYVAYAPQKIKNTIGEFAEANNLTQLRIAETEKYAHVTFFFNGGLEKPFNNEQRILVPSPKVATYDLKPEMSAYELTEELCKQIKSESYDLIICNYANPDMVGHTGSLSATIKAIEVIDNCLGEILDAVKYSSGQMLITADHGNAECMYNIDNKQPHTAHTHSVVPLVYINQSKDNSIKNIDVINDGSLEDIAPTILHLMGYKAPKEMTGKILFNTNEK